MFYSGEQKPDIDLGNDASVANVSVTVRASGDDQRVQLVMKRKPTTRKASDNVFDASYGSVIVADKYSEISLMLPTAVIYGLSGHPISFNQVAFYNLSFL